jgi:hypothetical protein
MAHASSNGGYAFTRDALVADIGGFHLSLPHPAPLILTAGSILLYCALIFVVWPTLYAHRAAAKKGKARAPLAYIHFVLLCLFSAVTSGAVLWHIVSTGELHSFTAFACTAVPPWMRVLSALFTLSKIWEWADTAVHFARDGMTVTEIGFLHLYHHATTFSLFLFVMNFPSTEKAGMLLNGFVHTLMYAHYAWRFPRWARPLITAAQIVQLVYVTWLWAITPQVCDALAYFPSKYKLEFVLPFLMVPVYTIFFLYFFYEKYISGGKEKET